MVLPTLRLQCPSARGLTLRHSLVGGPMLTFAVAGFSVDCCSHSCLKWLCFASALLR